jgi:hypothetical protein
MLSALVQSQAAIVAIVITLTLIAVQLTASAYSPRVVDIFRKNPDMWILLFWYGLSIFYGLVILKLVNVEVCDVVSQNIIWSFHIWHFGPHSISFECLVSFALWFGAFTFVALFPYMWNIIKLLEPTTIIKRLSEDILEHKISSYNKEKGDDPVLPIVDIISGSINKHDLGTVSVGLKELTNRMVEVKDTESKKTFLETFYNHLVRVGRLAIIKIDEEATKKVIINLRKLGEEGLKKKIREKMTLLAASSLGAVGTTAAEKGLNDVVKHAASSLSEIGKNAVSEDVLEEIAISFLGIGTTALEKKGHEDATSEAAEFFSRLRKPSRMKIFKTAIDDYKKLKGPNSSYLDEFIEKCKKKTRA